MTVAVRVLLPVGVTAFSATLSNCTISGNSAVIGGGIVNQATLSVSASCIIQTRASGGGGGDGIGALVTLKKTTVALNLASTSSAHIDGTVTYL
jgi:hypothetical protein